MTPRVPLPAGPGEEDNQLERLLTRQAVVDVERPAAGRGTDPPIDEIAPAPKHVLVVAHVEQHSGPIRSLMPRLAALAERGTKVTTLLPRRGSAAIEASQVGEVIYGTPGALTLPRNPMGLLRAAASARAQHRIVARTAQERGCDLIVLASLRLGGAMVAGRSSATGLVVYAGEPPATRALAARADKALAKIASKVADQVVVPSQRSAERLRAAGVESAVITPTVGLHGLPEEIAERAREFRRSFGIEPGERVVASLGAITAGRGQDILVEALASLEPAQRRWKLLIGGEPYRRQDDYDFERRINDFVIKHGLTDSVFFAGAISDVEAFHAAADVFVNPARVEESFGRAACEALLAGCSVVATRPAAAEGILENERTALIVPVDNPAATAAAVDRLLDDGELARTTSEAGAAEVRRRCDFWVRQPAFEATMAEALAAGARRA